MTSINKIYKDLKTASPSNFSTENFEDYQRAIGFLNDFVNSGVANWSFKGLFLGEEKTYHRNVWYVLSQRRADFFDKVVEFRDNPNDIIFNEILNLMYIFAGLPAIAYYLTKDESLERYGFTDKVIHYFLCSLSFFPIEEQKLLLKTLILYDETYYQCKPLPKSIETLMPLAFHLADDILDDDEVAELITQGKNKFSFNQFYQNVYENYLSDNEKITKQIFDELCDYHLKSCQRGRFVFNEFELLESQPIPFEIVILLQMRKKNGLKIDFLNHPLIKDVVNILNANYSFSFDEKTKIIRSRVFDKLNYKVN